MVGVYLDMRKWARKGEYPVEALIASVMSLVFISYVMFLLYIGSLLSCYLTLTFTRIPDNEWILLVMFYFFLGSVVLLTSSLFYLYSLTPTCIYIKLNQCSIWGGAYFPNTILIDQSTVLLLQQRPLGEYIVSNPSQLETISSFCVILINIYHHDKATIGPCSQSNHIFNTTELYM